MTPPVITYLIALFQADLDAKHTAATQQMAAEWLKVEARLQAEIEVLAAELAAPPGQPVKLDPMTGIVMKMQQAGYAPDYIQQLLATQGIFKIPKVPQPQAKQIKEWQLARLQRYVRLLAQTQAEIERFTGKVATPILDKLLTDSAYAGLENSLILMNAIITTSGGNAIDFTFDRLGIEAVQNIVAIAGAGKPLGDLLQAAYPLAAAGITDRLIYGTAAGQNPRQTAREVVQSGLAQGLNHILLVARDQQVRAVRTGAIQQYKNSGIVEGYIRLSAKQTRTCLSCLALDGQFFELDVPFIEHPQGRCTPLPVTKGFDRIQTESGEAWFSRQPAEVQRQMMGPGTYDAWKAGKFKFSQLATIKPNKTWGQSTQVTPLKYLLNGKGGFASSSTTPPKPQPSQPFSGPAARKLIGAMNQELNLGQYHTQFDESERLAKAAFDAGDIRGAEAHFDKMTEATRKIREAEDKVKSQIRGKLLYVDNPAKIKPDFLSRFTKEIKAKYQQGLEEFARLVGRGTLDGRTVGFKAKRAGRAYYDLKDRAIYLSKMSGIRVVLHEAGHWLEDMDSAVHQKALEFYDRRTQGDKLEWLGPGYGRKELTRRDRFINEYIGKEYKDRMGERYATEIISMGIEYLWDDPVRLAKEDPDYFDFIFELLRG